MIGVKHSGSATLLVILNSLASVQYSGNNRLTPDSWGPCSTNTSHSELSSQRAQVKIAPCQIHLLLGQTDTGHSQLSSQRTQVKIVPCQIHLLLGQTDTGHSQLSSQRTQVKIVPCQIHLLLGQTDTGHSQLSSQRTQVKIVSRQIHGDDRGEQTLVILNSLASVLR